MKILIMGDIHSNYVAFEKCIEEINSVDKIIMLGDYVSDCPYPQRTMEQVWHLKKHFQTCTLEKAKALERQHNHKGDVQNISEMYWEEAYDIIVEEYCRGNNNQFNGEKI